VSVFIEAMNVVVRNEAIVRIYPGGVQGFARDVPNATFCTDGRLSRVGFMNAPDLNHYVGQLVGRGLTFEAGGQAVDIALVDQQRGVHGYCPWLNIARHPDGYTHAWLVGTQPGPTHAPRGYDLEHYDPDNVRVVAQAEVDRDLVPVGPSGPIQAFRRISDGSVVYLGHTVPPATREVAERADAIATRVYELERVAKEVCSKGDEASARVVHSELTALAAEAMELASKEIDPSAHYVAGLAQRVLARWSEAVDQFERYAQAQPFDGGVWLDLTWCRSELGQLDAALEAARRAVEIAPDNPKALGNYAMVHCQLGRLGDAERIITRALELDPTDDINRNVLAAVNARKRDSRSE
jgi:hypothetical protein